MRKPLILVTDDEPNIRLVLRAALETGGYEVEEAADGREAIGRVDRRVPDLMLLDLSMPVLDGMGVLRAFETRPASRKPPVVVLTAYGSVAAAVRAVRLGARDFLEKPVTPDDLRAAIADVLAEPTQPDPDAPPPSYDEVLADVRDALRDEHYPDAESLLMRAGAIAPDDDAAFLNLAGVLHEATGRAAAARRFYGRAIRADKRYEPAQQNMRRLFELGRFGQTGQAVALGDEPPPPPDRPAEAALPPDLLQRLRRLVGHG